MIYSRYVLGPTDGTGLHGVYQQISHLWENGDGNSLYRVMCDDDGFQTLNSDTSLTVMPSLDAPAERLTGAVADHFAANGITASSGDTLLNMLRKLRNSKGLQHILIDKPH
jgi:hypothetical protein